jgi:hypothetical protein
MGASSEIFEEDFMFMFFRLSHGDNMDFVFMPCELHGIIIHIFMHIAR